jgi:nicotinate dehydrogenase subunit A
VTDFYLNGERLQAEGDEESPLVHVLRNSCDAKDVRFGCGAGNCGACTVIVDGVAQQSCGLSSESIEGCEVFTPAALQGDPIGCSCFTSFFR